MDGRQSSGDAAALGEEPQQPRLAAGAPLRAAVGIAQGRAGDAEVRVLDEGAAKSRQGACVELGVTVEQEDQVSAGGTQAAVGRGGESLRQLVAQNADGGKAPAQLVGSTVEAAVVDDETLEVGRGAAAEAEQACGGQLPSVLGGDDDREHGRLESGNGPLAFCAAVGV